MARRGYYAVARGKPPAPAIYSSWAAAQVVTQKYPDVIFKKFSTFEEAQAFMAGHGVARYRVEITFDVTCMMEESRSPTSGVGGGTGGKQFYVVANGSGKGVYESWEQAKVHIFGQPGICHQAFGTRQEADEWLWEYGRMQDEVEYRANAKQGLGNLSDLARELPEPQ
ncbi:unnamed protein product [Tuber melanosporum]|uniref:(Perigord truffle) hypothetical protein n=1 Tax=Tuber melanosporum (strain Mel28) TaxID=656061 RepID=D5GFS2_TUBMM|nr:uncharacterized protein GSTUM_00007048001 [Tuber melanosporum]CAZ83365.1 unnamed protein product [Tuber melanosporum]